MLSKVERTQNKQVQVVIGSQNTSTQVIGTTPSYAEITQILRQQYGLSGNAANDFTVTVKPIFCQQLKVFPNP
ncbi:hypothetical protein [Desulfosporosinus sp. Sb-LF]|uniref:hypothetical protein n=1 Tax=Desulfosporosinus sp. Sb-LF TaxID=2560027 RepID=UPI001FB188BF|nr:hypothetical protein [Desulfosporosinus sp. Sb-LF]